MASTLLLAACTELPGDDAVPDTEAAAYGDNALPKCSDAEDAERRWTSYRPGVCPPPHACVRIDQSGVYELPTDCVYDRVEFEINTSNVTLDCNGAVLAGHATGDGSIGLRVVDHRPVSIGEVTESWSGLPRATCVRERDPVANVTIRDCTVRGYDNGALVRLFPNGAKGHEERMRVRYRTWFHHRNEREYQMSQIDDCMRNAAPRNVTFDNVDLLGPHNDGLHVFLWVHGVTFRNGSIVGSKNGTGVYLSPGSRDNVISNNTIGDNYREGVAIDGSSSNRIIGNRIVANGLNWWYGLSKWDFTGRSDFFYVGITVFKNAWEDPEGAGPRTQHASDNVITANLIEHQDTGIWIGYRQGKDYQGTERGDPIYYVGADGDYNFKKFAERTTVTNNTFNGVRVGVRVQDDDAVITGNHFDDPFDLTRESGNDMVGVYVGHNVRRAAGEPVRGTVVRNNLFDTGHDYAVLEHDCAFETVVEGNNKGERGGTQSPVTTHKRGCSQNQSRMGMYLSGVGGPSGALTGLRTGGAFKSTHTWLAGDVDADGLDDLVSIFKADDQRTRIWLHRSSGSRFSYQDSFQTLEAAHQPAGGRWLIGNFDGVGGDDLVYIFGTSTTTYVYAWRAEGLGFSPRTATARFERTVLSNTPYSSTHRWLVGDINNDSRDDLVQVYPKDGSIRVVTHWSANGEAFGTMTSEQIFGAWDATHEWRLGDVSGDGRADLIQIFPDAAGNAQVRGRNARATTGFEWETWARPFYGSGGGIAGFRAGQQHWLMSDFDGNGRADLILIYGASGNARAWRNRSTGGGLVHVGIQTLDSYTSSQRYLSGRFNAGDARDDLALVYPRTAP